MQTESIATLSLNWQSNNLSSFQANDGSALELHSALNPASTVNYSHHYSTIAGGAERFCEPFPSCTRSGALTENLGE